jgi:allantoinase
VFDSVIRGGRVVSGTDTVAANVAIRDGKVVALLVEHEPFEAQTVYDAEDCLVLPGVIDAHVHSRAPSRPDRETWASATQGAARGGVTTIIEMPTSDPSASTPDVIRNRVRTGEGEAYVDFALYGAGASGDEKKVRALADEGVVGYKILSHAAPPGRDSEFTDMCVTSNAELYEGLEAIATTGLPVAVHAEDDSLLNMGVARMRAKSERSPLDHARSRPPFVEAVSIATLLLLAEETGAKLHLPHVSSALGLKQALRAKSEGADITIETCPHFLLFDETKLEELRGFAKMNPPLRRASDCAALWESIREGGIDVVASDHAPYLYEEKEPSDIFTASAGITGLEVLGPALYDRAARGEISFNTAASVLSEGPARVFGLAEKGKVAPGFDADIVILDPRGRWTFDKHAALSKAKESYRLYDGREFQGQINRVISRGSVVAESGKVVGSSGHGKYITPTEGARTTGS